MRELWNSMVITAIAMCLWTALYFLLVRPANQPAPAPTPSPTPTSPCITFAPGYLGTFPFVYPLNDNGMTHTLPGFKK